MAFTIETTQTGSHLVLTGEINISNNATLRDALEKAPSDKDLTIESSELSYIDSSGVACLIMAYKRFRKEGRSITLIQPSDALMNVLTTLKFDSLFQIA